MSGPTDPQLSSIILWNISNVTTIKVYLTFENIKIYSRNNNITYAENILQLLDTLGRKKHTTAVLWLLINATFNPKASLIAWRNILPKTNKYILLHTSIKQHLNNLPHAFVGTKLLKISYSFPFSQLILLRISNFSIYN